MATTSFPTIPKTPSSRKRKEEVDRQVGNIIKGLNDEWGINIPLPKEVGSPEKRGMQKEQLCHNMIVFLCWKDPTVFETLTAFNHKAIVMHTKWIHKPRAERGVVPETGRLKRRPMTSMEQVKMLNELFDFLFTKSESIKSQQAASPRSWRQNSFEGENAQTRDIDDSPLPFPRLKSDSKRPRDEPAAEAGSLKKVKTPEKTEVLATKNTNAMLPPTRGRPVVQDPKAWRSANTSFESNATSSIFSQSMRSLPPNTQETVPDLEEPNFQTQEDPGSATTREENYTSSEFNVGSSFEAALAETSDPNGLIQGSEVGPTYVEEELSQDIMDIAIEHDQLETLSNEDVLKDCLEDVFRKFFPRNSKPVLSSFD
jgi:hypothetical protein